MVTSCSPWGKCIPWNNRFQQWQSNRKSSRGLIKYTNERYQSISAEIKCLLIEQNSLELQTCTIWPCLICKQVIVTTFNLRNKLYKKLAVYLGISSGYLKIFAPGSAVMIRGFLGAKSSESPQFITVSMNRTTTPRDLFLVTIQAL